MEALQFFELKIRPAVVPGDPEKSLLIKALRYGPRAAEFAVELHGSVFDLDDHEFRLLYRACEGHTHERIPT